MNIENLAAELGTEKFPAGVYSDPEIFEWERDHLFSRSWHFLAHESEIPAKGDFVVRRMLDDAFIVARGDDGKVRVFLNRSSPPGREPKTRSASFNRSDESVLRAERGLPPRRRGSLLRSDAVLVPRSGISGCAPL